MTTSPLTLIYTFPILLVLVIPFSMSISLDTITPNTPIKDGEVLISARRSFVLGFFSPGNSPNRYVGIWYNKVPKRTVVWVANRNNPITDTSGVLAINGDRGGLVIYEKTRHALLWSANVSVPSENNYMVVKLLDVGNLVLFQNNSNQTLLWQSFDHPTNTLLPFMKLGLNRRSGLEWFLTSWKSTEDPGTGHCTHRINPSGYPQLFLYKDRTPLWRGGSWTGRRWSGIPEMTSNFIFNVTFVNNQDEIYISYGILNDSIWDRMVVEESESLVRSTWHDQVREWAEYWSAPRDWCDHYGQCGPNGNCDPSQASRFECVCLPGFEPKSPRNWYLRDGSDGCVRRKGVRTCGNGEGFVKLPRVKIPDTSMARVNMSLSLEACEQECLRNCSCTAYTSADENRGGIGCLTWHGDLVDTRTYSSVGLDLYVRVDATTLAQFANKPKKSMSDMVKLGISLVAVIVLLLVGFVALWMKRVKERQSNNSISSSIPPFSSYHEDISGNRETDESRASLDLPFFDFNTIAAATHNFSIDNKLGEGGFGSVYKGLLYNGKEIAVKRLSTHSRQGVGEFKNEVMVIAKLQHRNLVRILGYCVQGEERMLIYEYLPNKSLDSFIFDETKKKVLDWSSRFDIICGIARGMLYLHRDSRLRIIHRDLKASNVLLDDAMKPKIADFGMARIVEIDQIEASTNRVVGTYGYMSPEYAMEGRFSVKSDVYSFGVLLLEIITGRKNTGYYQLNPDSNLLGHVWELWREGSSLKIVDSALDKSVSDEVMRCIQIGLLCVQEYASDRPTMSVVVSMLGNDVPLPSPKQPAFVLKRIYTSSGDPSTSEGANFSINYATCTMVEPR